MLGHVHLGDVYVRAFSNWWCLCFTRWLLSANRHKGASRCKSNALSSPLPVSVKSLPPRLSFSTTQIAFIE